jgi:hypothetical protein
MICTRCGKESTMVTRHVWDAFGCACEIEQGACGCEPQFLLPTGDNGVKLSEDLVDPESGQVLAEAGDVISSEFAKLFESFLAR